MIVNPVAIATKGIYANDRNIALASIGYIDIAAVIINPAGPQVGGGYTSTDRFIQANNMMALQIIIDIDVFTTLAIGRR